MEEVIVTILILSLPLLFLCVRQIIGLMSKKISKHLTRLSSPSDGATLASIEASSSDSRQLVLAHHEVVSDDSRMGQLTASQSPNQALRVVDSMPESSDIGTRQRSSSLYTPSSQLSGTTSNSLNDGLNADVPADNLVDQEGTLSKPFSASRAKSVSTHGDHHHREGRIDDRTIEGDELTKVIHLSNAAYHSEYISDDTTTTGMNYANNHQETPSVTAKSKKMRRTENKEQKIPLKASKNSTSNKKSLGINSPGALPDVSKSTHNRAVNAEEEPLPEMAFLKQKRHAEDKEVKREPYLKFDKISSDEPFKRMENGILPAATSQHSSAHPSITNKDGQGTTATENVKYDRADDDDKHHVSLPDIKGRSPSSLHPEDTRSPMEILQDLQGKQKENGNGAGSSHKMARKISPEERKRYLQHNGQGSLPKAARENKYSPVGSTETHGSDGKSPLENPKQVLPDTFTTPPSKRPRLASPQPDPSWPKYPTMRGPLRTGPASPVQVPKNNGTKHTENIASTPLLKQKRKRCPHEKEPRALSKVICRRPAAALCQIYSFHGVLPQSPATTSHCSPPQPETTTRSPFPAMHGRTGTGSASLGKTSKSGKSPEGGASPPPFVGKRKRSLQDNEHGTLHKAVCTGTAAVFFELHRSDEKLPPSPVTTSQCSPPQPETTTRPLFPAMRGRKETGPPPPAKTAKSEKSHEGEAVPPPCMGKRKRSLQDHQHGTPSKTICTGPAAVFYELHGFDEKLPPSPGKTPHYSPSQPETTTTRPPFPAMRGRTATGPATPRAPKSGAFTGSKVTPPSLMGKRKRSLQDEKHGSFAKDVCTGPVAHSYEYHRFDENLPLFPGKTPHCSPTQPEIPATRPHFPAMRGRKGTGRTTPRASKSGGFKGSRASPPPLMGKRKRSLQDEKCGTLSKAVCTGPAAFFYILHRFDEKLPPSPTKTPSFAPPQPEPTPAPAAPTSSKDETLNADDAAPPPSPLTGKRKRSARNEKHGTYPKVPCAGPLAGPTEIHSFAATAPLHTPKHALSDNTTSTSAAKKVRCVPPQPDPHWPKFKPLCTSQRKCKYKSTAASVPGAGAHGSTGDARRARGHGAEQATEPAALRRKRGVPSWDVPAYAQRVKRARTTVLVSAY